MLGKVLFVEDDVLTNEVGTSLLKKRFETVISVQNGLKGLQAFKKNKPDIIITDLNMPVMCGCEMIQRIRAVDMTTPIIITTAHPEYLFGEIIYLVKPIHADELFKLIDDVMSHSIRSGIEDEVALYQRRHVDGVFSHY